MTHAEIAISFLQAATTGNVREAYERYVHPDFTHHNPYFPGDREALLKGMEESGQQFPHKEYHVLRTLEDGDLVAVHGRIRLAPGTPEFALVHILRFQNDKIIEEWEAGQQVPDDCPNKNGVF
jgi:predicted SnoaL-like aldol condensation-catalyzing enzyme